MISADRWYDRNPDLADWYQGDIVSDVPFCFLPTLDTANNATVWGILRPLDQRGKTIREVLRSLPTRLIGRAAKDITDKWIDPDGEYVIAGCRKMTVMLVSRSCAIVNPKRKHFLVAPVIAVEQLPEPQRTPEILHDLRKNHIPHHFYLPAFRGLPEAFADTLRLTPIHRTFFDPELLKSNLAARLSSVGMAALQQALSKHFGVQFGFDNQDTCPQTGMYACSNCFHAGMGAEARHFKEKAIFGDCPKCGEDVSWVKLP